MPVFKQRSLQQRISFILMLILVSTLLPSGALQPTAARAETSADPDSEIVYIDNTWVIRILDLLQSGSTPKVDWFSATNG